MKWFEDEQGFPWDVLLTGLAVYLAVVVLLRITGKRTLAQLNIFDLIVTVAIGSLIATTVVSDGVSVIEGLVGLTTLVALQFAVATLNRSMPSVRSISKSEPRALLVDGRIIEDALTAERITVPELRAAVRQSGFARLENVGAVVLETNGKLSVLADAAGSALEGVTGIDPAVDKGERSPG